MPSLSRTASIVLITGLSIGGITATALPGGVATAASANAKFKGVWTVAGSAGFVITSENRTTGTCKGTSDAGPGYGLTACKVTGHTYVFTITYGPVYKSYNAGRFSKTHLSGSFHDTNGTTAKYTATRP
jgi:hypothetical protein